MKHSKGGMGSHKHGTSGRASHSPRFRHMREREVNAANNLSEERRRKLREIAEPKSSVSDLFGAAPTKKKKKKR